MDISAMEFRMIPRLVFSGLLRKLSKAMNLATEMELNGTSPPGLFRGPVTNAKFKFRANSSAFGYESPSILFLSLLKLSFNSARMLEEIYILWDSFYLLFSGSVKLLWILACNNK